MAWEPMILYRTQPADDVLIDYAFEKYPDCNKLILYTADHGLREVRHYERETGVTYTFSTDHLWKLRMVDQANFERLLPVDAERQYA